MWLLMMLKQWDDLAIETVGGKQIRITGYAMPMEGGGRIPATAFMPVFSTYEHAEAARGDAKETPIYEITAVAEGFDPDNLPGFDEIDPYDPNEEYPDDEQETTGT